MHVKLMPVNMDGIEWWSGGVTKYCSRTGREKQRPMPVGSGFVCQSYTVEDRVVGLARLESIYLAKPTSCQMTFFV